MDLAKRNGLLHVNMGMESVNPETLGQMNKRFNKVSQYAAIADALRRRGISGGTIAKMTTAIELAMRTLLRSICLLLKGRTDRHGRSQVLGPPERSPASSQPPQSSVSCRCR